MKVYSIIWIVLNLSLLISAVFFQLVDEKWYNHSHIFAVFLLILIKG